MILAYKIIRKRQRKKQNHGPIKILYKMSVFRLLSQLLYISLCNHIKEFKLNIIRQLRLMTQYYAVQRAIFLKSDRLSVRTAITAPAHPLLLLPTHYCPCPPILSRTPILFRFFSSFFLLMFFPYFFLFLTKRQSHHLCFIFFFFVV